MVNPQTESLFKHGAQQGRGLRQPLAFRQGLKDGSLCLAQFSFDIEGLIVATGAAR